MCAFEDTGDVGATPVLYPTATTSALAAWLYANKSAYPLQTYIDLPPIVSYVPNPSTMAQFKSVTIVTESVGGDRGGGGGKGGDGGGGGAIHVERTVLHDEGLTEFEEELAQVYFAWNAVAYPKIFE
ncbi:unnamed protein product [Bathycoccus prasinos]